MDYTEEEKKKREKDKQKLMEQFPTLDDVKAEQLKVQKKIKQAMKGNWESDETDVDELHYRLALLQEIEREYKEKKLKNKVKKSLQEARFGVNSEESKELGS
jgi:uncharacterized small protein (DUF1192 family)